LISIQAMHLRYLYRLSHLTVTEDDKHTENGLLHFSTTSW